MKTVKGNLIDLAENGEFDLIVHGANCFHTMGSGIAKEIRARYPQVYKVDCEHSDKGDKEKLGTYTGISIDSNSHRFIVLNGYTQFEYGYEGKDRCDYDAIKLLFKTIKEDFSNILDVDVRIGYPKIGCGLAGGDWDLVSKIIDEELEGMNHTYVEFG